MSKAPSLSVPGDETVTKKKGKSSPRESWVVEAKGLGFWVFMAVAVATCGWAPNCAEDSDAAPADGEQEQGR